MQVCVHFGLFNAVMAQYPDHVREGFIERLHQLNTRLDEEIEAIQSFGEYFDE